MPLPPSLPPDVFDGTIRVLRSLFSAPVLPSFLSSTLSTHVSLSHTHHHPSLPPSLPPSPHTESRPLTSWLPRAYLSRFVRITPGKKGGREGGREGEN